MLPFLKIKVEVDVSSEKGQVAAANEFAFQNEPFAPVYTVATLRNTGNLESFCTAASKFCNDCLFGSLSGTVSVAPSVESSEEFQTLIATLKYGGIGINTWAAFCYSPPMGRWGTYPGESLDKAESGTQSIQNLLCLPHCEKFVMRGLILSIAHSKLK